MDLEKAAVPHLALVIILLVEVAVEYFYQEHKELAV